MVDYIKIQIQGICPKSLEQNPLLNFGTRINPETGEQLAKYSTATYKGLKFKIYDPTEANPAGRITVEGSLHKFWNNGGHNFNDFGRAEVDQVLEELKRDFALDPANCILMALEIGVNISPPAPTDKILQYCLMHKTTVLTSSYTPEEGSYKQGRHQRHTAKLYNKRKHYQNRGFQIDREILRIEKKWERTQELHQMGIFTLADLMQYGLHNFTAPLLQMWDSVLFYCWQTLDGTKYQPNYSNPNYWQSLSRENFKYHRRNLNRLLAANPQNLKDQIRQRLRDKIKALNSNPTQINPLSILLKRVGRGEGPPRVCKVTGLNIEMQREGSFLLSHTGIRYYQKNDRPIFADLKRKFLSDKWSGEPIEVQIRELAHNIRNHHNNGLIRQRQIYPAQQYNLLAMVK